MQSHNHIIFPFEIWGTNIVSNNLNWDCYVGSGYIKLVRTQTWQEIMKDKIWGSIKVTLRVGISHEGFVNRVGFHSSGISLIDDDSRQQSAWWMTQATQLSRWVFWYLETLKRTAHHISIYNVMSCINCSADRCTHHAWMLAYNVHSYSLRVQFEVAVSWCLEARVNSINW